MRQYVQPYTDCHHGSTDLTSTHYRLSCRFGRRPGTISFEDSVALSAILTYSSGIVISDMTVMKLVRLGSKVSCWTYRGTQTMFILCRVGYQIPHFGSSIHNKRKHSSLYPKLRKSLGVCNEFPITGGAQLSVTIIHDQTRKTGKFPDSITADV